MAFAGCVRRGNRRSRTACWSSFAALAGVAQICCVGGLGGVALRQADRSVGCASLGNFAYTNAAIEVQDQRRELLHCHCMTDACPASRSRRNLDPNWTPRTVLSSAILWNSETRRSLSSLHHCIFCPLLSDMACLIAPQALIMPAVVRRPQHLFKAGRHHLAVRIKSFSPQILPRRSVEVVAARQNRQPDAVTPHRINRSGATAARATHLPPDHCEVDRSVDSRSSFMDLHSCWRRLADGAAALTVIMALVRCHASHILIAVRTHGSFTYPAVRSFAFCFDSPH